MVEEAKKGEMTMLLPMCVAQWEWKLDTQDQRQVAAEQAQVARMLLFASEARQKEEQPLPQKPILKRLFTSLRYAGA
jgi:hypothetical protein